MIVISLQREWNPSRPARVKYQFSAGSDGRRRRALNRFSFPSQQSRCVRSLLWLRSYRLRLGAHLGSMSPIMFESTSSFERVGIYNLCYIQLVFLTRRWEEECNDSHQPQVRKMFAGQPPEIGLIQLESLAAVLPDTSWHPLSCTLKWPFPP
jgi:hypothetical protein